MLGKVFAVLMLAAWLVVLKPTNKLVAANANYQLLGVMHDAWTVTALR